MTENGDACFAVGCDCDPACGFAEINGDRYCHGDVNCFDGPLSCYEQWTYMIQVTHHLEVMQDDA